MADYHYLKILNRRAARGSAGERLGYVELDKVKPLERKKYFVWKSVVLPNIITQELQIHLDFPLI